MDKLFSILIGYIFGSFLTAELVAKHFAGKRASELGDTGNPGMANMMASLGFKAGILTLTGDLLKCLAAGLLSFFLFRSSGWIVTLYAGLGCTLGHDFPFWRGFKGGKGVATTSMAIGLYSFWPGLISNIAGLITVLLTSYLCIGGPVIPLAFTLIIAFTENTEAAAVGAVLTVLSFLAHKEAIAGIRQGKTKKTNIIKALLKRNKRSAS